MYWQHTDYILRKNSHFCFSIQPAWLLLLHSIKHKSTHSAIVQSDIFCSNGTNLLCSLRNTSLKINYLNRQLDFQWQKIISNIHMRFPFSPFPLTCFVLYPVEGAVHKSLGECSRKKWTSALRSLCGTLFNQMLMQQWPASCSALLLNTLALSVNLVSVRAAGKPPGKSVTQKEKVEDPGWHKAKPLSVNSP